jgi:hypothetical protein
MSFDSSDYSNSATERVIRTLQGFASLDPDMEAPVFMKGYPTIAWITELSRPLIAVYVYNDETADTGYDNVVDTNGLPTSDSNWSVTTGVECLLDFYIDVFVEKGTADKPVRTGGATVASRIAGKIQTRLILNPECLGGALDIVRNPVRSGPFEPADSSRIPLLFYRIDFGLSVIVTEELNSSVLVNI